MTRNPVTDGEEFSAVYWSGMGNAHAREGVLNGCTPSKGTGSWDVDVAAGDVIIGSSRASVTAQTVTLTAPSNDTDLDSGEFRVDLVTINSTGSAVVTEGTAATSPIAPDIPSSEVLIAAVLVSGDATSLTSADIDDYRMIIDDTVENRGTAGALGSVPKSQGDGTLAMEQAPNQQELWDRHHFADDFADNKLTNRDNPSTTPSELGNLATHFRPEYETLSGTPSVSGSALQLSAGDTTAQEVAAALSTRPRIAELEFQLGANATAGSVYFPFWDQDGNNQYRIRLSNAGALELQKRSGGTTTILISGTYTEDGTVQTTRVERTGKGEWELFHEGVSQGTASDTFNPNPHSINISNTADVSVDVNYWVIE